MSEFSRNALEKNRIQAIRCSVVLAGRNDDYAMPSKQFWLHTKKVVFALSRTGVAHGTAYLRVHSGDTDAGIEVDRKWAVADLESLLSLVENRQGTVAKLRRRVNHVSWRLTSLKERDVVGRVIAWVKRRQRI